MSLQLLFLSSVPQTISSTTQQPQLATVNWRGRRGRGGREGGREGGEGGEGGREGGEGGREGGSHVKLTIKFLLSAV